MGACYDVNMQIAYDDEQAVIDATNAFIDAHDGRTANFGLDYYKAKGIGREQLDDIIKLIITDRGFESNGKGYYQSGFDASYGWESLMMNWFSEIARTLNDGSELKIYPDSDYDHLVVRNGRAVQLH